MKEIKLSKGKVALVDDEFNKLSKNKWYYSYNGYAVRGQWIKEEKRRIHIFMHRVIMNAPKAIEIDHINGDKLDNRKCNLRFVTKSQNGMNSKSSKDSTSRYKGISWHKKNKKWQVCNLRSSNF